MKNRSLALPTALLVALTACASSGTSGQSFEASPDRAPEGAFLYAPSQDDARVSVIDIGTLEVVGEVDLRELGFGPNAKPHHVGVEPDGSYWYLSLIGENRVVKFDRENRMVGQARFDVPGMVVPSPAEDVLFVGRSMSAVNPPSRIGRIDRTTLEVEEVDVFFPRPHAVAVSPEGAPVFTASLAVNRMAAVRPDEEEVELVDLEGAHHTLVQFAVSPDGRHLVGTGEMTGRLLVFDVSDPDEPRRVATVEVGSRPWHPVFTLDGGEVWVPNKGSNTVSVVDTERWVVVETIEHADLDMPHGSAVSPDGRLVFVSNNGSGGGEGSVVVIDRESREVVGTIPLGRNVAGLGTAAGR